MRKNIHLTLRKNIRKFICGYQIYSQIYIYIKIFYIFHISIT